MKKFLLLIIISSLFVSNACFASVTAKVTKTNNTAQNTLSEQEYYKKAQIDLDKNLYTTYRVGERLIRANKLYDYAWAFEIPYQKDYEMNAQSTEANFIQLKSGVINTFGTDISSLAFIIAHEMAHHIQKHIANQSRETSVDIENASKKLDNVQNNFNSNSQEYTFLKAISPLGAYFLTKDDIEKQNEVLKEETENLKADTLARSRRYEYEADKLALIMITKAGFSPNASINTMKLLDRLPDVLQENSTHPSTSHRIYRLKQLINSTDVQKLKQEGELNIKNSRYLTYEKIITKQYTAISRKTLVINSLNGSYDDVNTPFQKMFGY